MTAVSLARKSALCFCMTLLLFSFLADLRGANNVFATEGSNTIRLFDGKQRLFVVNGYSTSAGREGWPVFLQRKLDRYLGGRVIEVKTALKGGTPIARWMEVSSGEPLKPWLEIARPVFEENRSSRNLQIILLAQQSLQWMYGQDDRAGGINGPDDLSGIKKGAAILQRYAELCKDEGATLVFIGMHIFKNGMEPQIGNERLALKAVMKLKVPYLRAGPDVWTPTKELYPQAFRADRRHPNSIGGAVMAHYWFETLLGHDGLEVPSWSREEMEKAIAKGLDRRESR